jgi:hypothetical protein
VKVLCIGALLAVEPVHFNLASLRYEAFLPLHKTSRFGDVLINTAKVIFETHGLFCASGIHEVPDCRLIDASMGYLSWGHA